MKSRVKPGAGAPFKSLPSTWPFVSPTILAKGSKVNSPVRGLSSVGSRNARNKSRWAALGWRGHLRPGGNTVQTESCCPTDFGVNLKLPGHPIFIAALFHHYYQRVLLIATRIKLHAIKIARPIGQKLVPKSCLDRIAPRSSA